jgi:hypothetical protein
MQMGPAGDMRPNGRGGDRDFTLPPAVGWDRGSERASHDVDVYSTPLTFRTAGFPQYDWKVGMSGET